MPHTDLKGGDKAMKKLQEHRLKKGYSQSELSAVSGVPVYLIQSYEQGARSIDRARLDTLCSLALALGVQLYEILESPALRAKMKTVSKATM